MGLLGLGPWHRFAAALRRMSLRQLRDKGVSTWITSNLT